MNLQDVIQRNLVDLGERVAIDTPSEAVTYRALGEVTTAIGSRLGFETGPVAFATGAGLPSYLAYLAIVRAGRTAVPIGPGWPRQRAQAAIARTGAMVLLQTASSPLMPEALENGVGCDGVDLVASHVEPPANDPAVAPHIAYVLFTSGSTGSPKGTPVPRSAVEAYLEFAVARYDIQPGARMSATFELSFDLGTHDALASIVGGATLVLPRPREAWIPTRYVERAKLTHWFSVPSIISMADGLNLLTSNAMSSLRWSLFCGEALTLQQAAKWAEAAPQSVIDNLYGPTECTLACLVYRLPEARAEWPATTNGTVPIGTTFEHLEHRIGSGRSAEELMVRGSQRFDGYLPPDDRNATFEADSSCRHGPDVTCRLDWYRTGDEVRSEAGNVVYQSRLDRQVQVGGNRVELGEIESTLREQRHVDNAYAWTFRTAGMTNLAVGLVSGRLTSGEGRSLVQAVLPDYMRPKSVLVSSSPPLNANGKVDTDAWMTSSNSK